MSRNKIIRYNKRLKPLARKLRQNSTMAEILLWMNIKGKVFGYEFHRQVPIDEYIVDFYCHELKLVLEVDRNTHDYNYENDMNRQQKLEDLGIRVVRFSDEDIKKFLNDVLRGIEAVIVEIEEGK